MMHALRHRLLAAGLAAACIGLSAAGSHAQDGLATYKSDRYGFSLSYPAAQFIALPAVTEEARQFISKDGKARLLVGTLNNSGRRSLADYRDFLLGQSYAGAKIDYTALRGNWFVVSGDRAGMTFYERVTFTCGGRIINSWAMLFPTADKPTYDRVIEQIHRAYRVADGRCAPASVAGR
jgi:hypothetical protein